MGRTFGKYRIIKTYPDGKEEIIHTQVGLENTLSLLALFEQRFVIDTKIGMLKGNISQEEGKELLHKVNFNHVRI